MTKPIHLVIRAGERFFINGAVIRFPQKTAIELVNEARFLLEHHVLQQDDVTTPLRGLYFLVQGMVISPEDSERLEKQFTARAAQLMAGATDPDLVEGLLNAVDLVSEGRHIDALKLLRGLYGLEDQPRTLPVLAAAPIEPTRQPEYADEDFEQYLDRRHAAAGRKASRAGL